MFSVISKFFFLSKKSKKDNDVYKAEFNEAVQLQKEGLYKESLEIYNNLYSKLKALNHKEKLLPVIKNIILIKIELKEEANELFEEMFKLNFSLVMLDEDYYTIDYINTLLLGVEYFGLPKEKLEDAKMLLESYEKFYFYKEAIKKIEKLNNLHLQ